MRRAWRSCRLTLTIALAIAAAWAGSLEAGSREDRERLDEANQRWRGASCRTRVTLELKKGKDSDGWVRSKWLFWGEPHSNERAQVLFSPADELRRRFPRGIVPAGSELVVTGWQEQKPGGTLFLVLELPGTPITARVSFWDDWVGKVNAGRIDDFEQWARFDLLELVSVPDEQLQAIAQPARPAPASTPAHPGRDPSPASVAAGPPLQLLAVAVEPVSVRPGDQVGLVISYLVGGSSSGAPVEVVERRRLLRDGEEVAAFEQRVAREAGTFSSTLPVRVPAELSPGLYTVVASVTCAGGDAEGSALLHITR